MLSPEVYKTLSREAKNELARNCKNLKRKARATAWKSSHNNNDESAEAYTPPTPSTGPVKSPRIVEKSIIWKDPIDEVLSST
jgi:site-specific DNA-adenine methylase